MQRNAECLKIVTVALGVSLSVVLVVAVLPHYHADGTDSESTLDDSDRTGDASRLVEGLSAALPPSLDLHVLRPRIVSYVLSSSPSPRVVWIALPSSSRAPPAWA